VKYFTQDKVMFWRFDGERVQVLECGRWVRSIFTSIADMQRVLGERVHEVTESELPKQARP
jgi:hypothetical protein